ncbi:MAG: hypothetical protein JXD19_06985 [Deltaproteobacteria bacterium]|nr:hypothetical protein [Deltaproteobacteria bacterium]
MSANVSGFLTLLILAFGISLLVYYLVHGSLRRLLDEVVKLPDCTTFYSRVFFIGLLFIALSSALGTTFDLKDAAFMEYVWKVASGLAKVFHSLFWFLVAYLAFLTILVAVLRRRHE